jgi:hypothetical protein
MIIVEGVDRVGKSSLVKVLARNLGFKIVHCVVPPDGESVFDYHMRMIQDGEDAIVDRLHWSEYAYGETYRQGCGYTKKQWRQLEDELQAAEAGVILLSDSLKLIRERWGPEEQFDVAGLVRLDSFFFDVFFNRAPFKSDLPRRHYNWRDFFNPDGSERGDALKTMTKSLW